MISEIVVDSEREWKKPKRKARAGHPVIWGRTAGNMHLANVCAINRARKLHDELHQVSLGKIYCGAKTIVMCSVLAGRCWTLSLRVGEQAGI